MIDLGNEIISSLGCSGEYIVEGTPLKKMRVWEILAIMEADGCSVEYNGRQGVVTNIDWESHSHMTFMIDESMKGRSPSAAALNFISAANIPITSGAANTTIPVTISVGGNLLGQNYLITGVGNGKSSIVGYTISKPQSNSPDLPDLVLKADDEHGRSVEITLSPDQDLSAHETLKIMMLIMAFVNEPEIFNALNYIKKNNLERHFKYA